MNERKYPRLGERVFHEVLPNGLHIYVSPKAGFQKNYAFFATNYGGMDMRFCLDGTWHDTPAGVAHFLEHKMFDTEDGNALQELAATGASPNAFTGTALTGYYFEGTEQFEQNLRILLSFVSVPWFTAESVEKEQGIIAQEIRMIEDDPNWQVYMQLMSALYEAHPVRVPVAGTRESISHITAETLYACHRAFYRPSNMVLCVAGDVDAARVCDIAREILPAAPSDEPVRGRTEEGEAAAHPVLEQEMEVSVPIFQLGFKCDPPPDGEGALRQKLLGELACEALLGTSTALYARLYAEGLVNSSFSYGYDGYPGCALLAAGGESRDPQAVRAAVLAEAGRIAAEGLDEALWGRLKKAAYGGRVRALNSFEHLCVEQAQSHFLGAEYLLFPAVFERIEKRDAEEAIASWVCRERCALSVIRPKGAKAG